MTGASGFIGRALLGYAAEFSALSWRGSSRRPNQILPVGVEHVPIGDLSGRTNWSSALAGVNAVVHSAARVHVMRDPVTDPLADYRRVNVDGTLALAEQAARAGVRRLVFLSSVKVNGESTIPGQAFAADDDPAPQDPYGVSKLEAERELISLAERTDLDVVIIRPVLVYGPGVGGNFLSLMRWVRAGVPLPLGAIENRRSFIALENLLHFIVVSLTHPEAANQVFLVSDGEDLSTPALIRGIATAMNRPTRLVSVRERTLHACGKLIGCSTVVDRLLRSLQVDIEKARTVLGWAPPIRVDQGLETTVRHFLKTRRKHTATSRSW